MLVVCLSLSLLLAPPHSSRLFHLCARLAAAPGQCRAHPSCGCGLVSLPGKLVKKLLMQLLPTGCRARETEPARERETERGGERSAAKEVRADGQRPAGVCRHTHTHAHIRTQHTQCTHGTKVLPTLRRKQKFSLTCAKAAAGRSWSSRGTHCANNV